MLILGILVGIPILYALTTLVVLCFAKIEKEPDGTPILDTNSWHFKLAYPTKRYNKQFIEEGPIKISICAYFIKLFIALWIEWPLILVISVIGTITPSIISILFGYVSIMDWKIWWYADEAEDYFRGKEVWLPAIRGHRIWPISLVVPAIYIWLLRLNSKLTLHWTFIALGIILAIAIFIALVELCCWFSETDRKKVSLAREWLKAKKRRFCPFMKVKTNGISAVDKGPE